MRQQKHAREWPDGALGIGHGESSELNGPDPAWRCSDRRPV